MIVTLIKYYVRTGLFFKFHVVLIPILVNYYFHQEIIPSYLGLLLIIDEFALIEKKLCQRVVIVRQVPNRYRLVLGINLVNILMLFFWLSPFLVFSFYKDYPKPCQVLFEVLFMGLIASSIGNIVSLKLSAKDFWKKLLVISFLSLCHWPATHFQHGLIISVLVYSLQYYILIRHDYSQ